MKINTMAAPKIASFLIIGAVLKEFPILFSENVKTVKKKGKKTKYEVKNHFIYLYCSSRAAKFNLCYWYHAIVVVWAPVFIARFEIWYAFIKQIYRRLD